MQTLTQGVIAARRGVGWLAFMVEMCPPRAAFASRQEGMA
jgi:hypothetical protein